jgi:hypothetical protein
MLIVWAAVLVTLIFAWIFFLPMFMVGFLLSIPFFTIALPISLLIAGGVFLAFDHIKESTIRDILTSAPYHMWFGKIHVPIPEGKYLICCHPHGILCTAAIVGIHFRPKSKTLIAVAPIVFLVPVIGWIAKHLGAIPATYHDILKGLETTSVILLPGGVPEIIASERKQQYTKRWGFLKCAQKANVDILKIKTDTHYELLPMPFYDTRMYIAQHYNVPITFPWVFGWCGSWIPQPKPITPKVKRFQYIKGHSIEQNRIKYYIV